jgi:hypothetical protein
MGTDLSCKRLPKYKLVFNDEISAPGKTLLIDKDLKNFKD